MVREPGMRGRDGPWDPRDGREAGGEKKVLIARKSQLTVVARARQSEF